MDVYSLFNIAIGSILRNKSRSLLTTLGIIIGVTSVILLVSIGNGLQTYVSGQFKALGSNLIFIMPYEVADTFVGGGPPVTSRGFNSKDVRAIRRLGYPITSVYPVIERAVKVAYRGDLKSKYSISSTANYAEAKGLKMSKGRFFSSQEEERGRRVAVLGWDAADNLFGGVDPIGKLISVGSTRYRVVGVVAKIGSSGFGPSMDNALYLPITTSSRQLNLDRFDHITVGVAVADQMETVKKMLDNYLTQTREKDEYSIMDQSQILETIGNVLGAITAAIGGIAAISLVVGGIGVMNIMLVSVTERTREIGLRKAVGATPNLIMAQFLIEAMVLSLTGGLIGISLGIGGSLLINIFFPSFVSLFSIVLAFGVSAAVGIVFGILPARRAAKLSPINALRYE